MFGGQVSSDDEVKEEKEAEEEDPKRESLVKKGTEDEETPAKKNGVNDTQEKDKVAGREGTKQDHVFAISSATIYFHIGMILAACYLSMLCTNWGNMSIFDDTTNFFQGSDGSYWLKIVA